MMIMMIVLITGKQGGDPQSEDCSRHRDNGEPGVVQWSITPPQSSHLGCYLRSFLLLSTVVQQQNSNKPKPFLLTIQLYMKVCLYFYLIVRLLSLYPFMCILNKQTKIFNQGKICLVSDLYIPRQTFFTVVDWKKDNNGYNLLGNLIWNSWNTLKYLDLDYIPFK